MYDFKLTPAYCLYNGVAVLEQHGAEIMFLMENINDLLLQGRLRRSFNNYLNKICELENCPEYFRRDAHVDFVNGNRTQIRKCVTGLYKISERKEILNQKENDYQQKEAAAVLLLDGILNDARNRNATDIHIGENSIKFRINGVLENYMDIQFEHVEELMQRIKLLAGMNIVEKQKCQGGRFVYGKNNPIFVRVSLVVVYDKENETKESIVLRILDTSRIPLVINKLGFNEKQLMRMERFQFYKHGLILVCGSTGSGKSTTVASLLVELERRNQGQLKIISMEDPPEYVIPGVSQIQINEEKGNSYDKVLTHIFRQDPDVIMVGEIRDKETAETAVRAALTGHLVFATLHTSGAGESVLRMGDLGVKMNILMSVLKGVICQELSFENNCGVLCADVAVPKDDKTQYLREDMTEDELDRYFDHCTNYSEILSKAISVFNQFEENVTPGIYRNPADFIWRNSGNDKKLHKKIG